MKKDIEGVIDRFKGLLELQKVLQMETIEAKFTEYDLKEIIYLLGDLKAIEELYDRIRREN